MSDNTKKDAVKLSDEDLGSVAGGVSYTPQPAVYVDNGKPRSVSDLVWKGQKAEIKNLLFTEGDDKTKDRGEINHNPHLKSV